MGILTDTDLLRRYAEEGSEAAFSELVSRQVNLVYSTALRLVGGDEHLAYDVAQCVFTDLARKAAQLNSRRRKQGEREDPANLCLTGWLYTSTRFAAAKSVRAEQTRRKHEQEAHAMNELINQSPPEPDWSQLRLLLDDAMGQLTDADRDAVLLRFFEGKELRAVGAVLGWGEDAARKRVSRALDKLRKLLARRGIKTTTAALSVALAAHAVQAAPIGFAAALAGASLASAGAVATSTLGMLKLMASMKVKLGIAALVGAAVITPVVIDHQHRKQAGEQFGQQERQHLESKPHLEKAQQHLVALIIFSSNNGDKLPDTLEEAGLNNNQFELLFKGSLKNLSKPGSTIVIREKEAWRTAKGTWAKTYGFADGHSEVAVAAGGNFGEWERERAQRDDGPPRTAKE
jgi:RNA polymerase sigma factor (sigma-70 family)